MFAGAQLSIALTKELYELSLLRTALQESKKREAEMSIFRKQLSTKMVVALATIALTGTVMVASAGRQVRFVGRSESHVAESGGCRQGEQD